MTILTSIKDYKKLKPSVRESLMNYLEFAINKVPFYSKFKSKDINYKEFFNFPICYDYDLLTHPSSFVPKDSRIVQYTSSGGTYGKRKIIFRTNNDIKKSVKTTISMFLCGGITPKDKIAILQPFDLWNIGHIALLALRKIRALSIPIGLSLNNDAILNVLALTQCNIIYGTPSKIITLAELSKKKNINPKINKIFCAGELILQTHRDKIKEIWNAEIYGIYGSEETDGIGAECKRHSGYHIFDEGLIIEILNPKTLLPSEDNKGALVVTKLNYTGTILIRYLLGDLVKIIKQPCRCGRKELRVFPKERIKEIVWLYDGRKVPLSSIEDILRAAFQKIPQYQVVVRNSQKGTNLILKIRFKNNKSIERKLRKMITESSQDMEEMANKKEIKINFHLSQNLSIFTFTERGKLPKIIYEENKS